MRERKPEYSVVDIGGSLLFDEHQKLNSEFLTYFVENIRQGVRAGRKYILVVGGGRVCRWYQEGARGVGVTDNVSLDEIGIASTLLNAELLRVLFTDAAQPALLRNFETPVDKNYALAIGGGVKPGSSKDLDACLWAKKVGAKVIVRASNIAYVYDRDPRKDAAAKAYTSLSWREYQGIIGDKWTPGLASPFDPVAARYAAEHNLEVHFFDGQDKEAFANALLGKAFTGTIIHSN